MEERDDSVATRIERDRVRTRDYIQLDPHVFVGLVPVAVFLVANYFGPAQLAIGLSFAASIIVFARNRGHGAVRFLSMLGFVIVTVSAVIGIAADSERAFVAQNIVSDFIFAAVFVGSVLVGRPLIGEIAREAAPAIQPVMPSAHAVFVRLTLLNAGINIVTGVARIFLFQSLSVNAYVIASRAIGAPLTIAFIIYCYYEVTRTAIAIWPADVEPPQRGRAGAAARRSDGADGV
jgi:intracellular septation protein A